MRITAFLAFVAMVLPVFAQERYEGPIIDMHLHAIPVAAWQDISFCPGDIDKEFPAIDPREENSRRDLELCSNPLQTPTSDEMFLEEMLGVLNRYNITGVVIGSQERIASWQEAAAGRVIPALPVRQFDGLDLRDMRQRIRAGGIKVLGEIWTQQNGLSPSGPELEPLLALAEELDIPVGIHMGPGTPGHAYFGDREYRARLTNPLELEEALLRHPTLRVYVMHAGYPMVDAMIHMLYSHPQLYVDVSVINWYHPRAHFHHFLQQLVEAGFGSRIMFGSDQVVWPKATEIAVESIETAEFLTAEQKRDIFYNNAARFLRLGE